MDGDYLNAKVSELLGKLGFQYTGDTARKTIAEALQEAYARGAQAMRDGEFMP